MDMKVTLSRIEARRIELGLSESAVAAQAGSRDLIRNWRRALDAGHPIKVRHESLVAIADALSVTTAWLLGETAAKPDQPHIPGLSETAAPYQLRPHPVPEHSPSPALAAIFGSAIQTPASFVLSADLPAFALCRGDILAVDLSRMPTAGELAIVTLHDDQTATTTTTVRRYLPPFLASGICAEDTTPMRVDQPGVTVRHPVIGSIRGA